MEPFLALGFPFRPLGAHLEDTGGKKSVPKASKGNFVDIVKTLIFLCFLTVLGGLGSPWSSKWSP